MAIYDPNSNQHSDGRDSEASFTPMDKRLWRILYGEEAMTGYSYNSVIILLIKEIERLHLELEYLKEKIQNG